MRAAALLIIALAFGNPAAAQEALSPAAAGPVETSSAAAPAPDAFSFEKPLSADALALGLGVLRQGDAVISLGLTTAQQAARLSVASLPKAPALSGLSPLREAAVKTVMNEVTPIVLTNVLGAQIPISSAGAGSVPLFAGVTAIPISGRP